MLINIPLKKQLFFILLALIINFVNAQESITLSGTITELKTNESLIGVNVIIPELQTGAVTNEYGFYSITIPKGSYKIQVSFLGFKTINQNLNLTQSTIQNFKLEESFEELKLIPLMIVGSVPFVIITWILSYFSFLNIFKSYRNKVKKNNNL